MIRSHVFELVVFDNNADNPETFYERYEDKAHAKRIAGAKCKKTGGPVDIAYAGPEPWEERYITTALPSEYHSKGYQFEYLDG